MGWLYASHAALHVCVCVCVCVPCVCPSVCLSVRVGGAARVRYVMRDPARREARTGRMTGLEMIMMAVGTYCVTYTVNN